MKTKPPVRKRIAGVTVSAMPSAPLEVNTGRFVWDADNPLLIDEEKIVVTDARTFSIFEDGSFNVGPLNENPPAGQWLWLSPDEVETVQALRSGKASVVANP